MLRLLVAVAAAAVTLAAPCPWGPVRELQFRRDVLCASLVGPTTPWCRYGSLNGTKVHHDWPTQAVYMQQVLDAAIAVPDRCFISDSVNGQPTQATSTATLVKSSASAAAGPSAAETAQQLIRWLGTTQADPSVGGAFMWTWRVFQVGYYNMPYHPGQRVETPWTLGLKCWAMAFNTQFWFGPRATGTDVERTKARLSEKAAAVSRQGGSFNLTTFVQQYDAASAETMTLCRKVMANCFVNATYDPARNGTCPFKVDAFRGGFTWQNFKLGSLVKYPF